MRPNWNLYVYIISAFLVQISKTGNPNQQKLILILLDGFRWDYFRPGHVGFHKMFNEGVKADYLQPVFPSVSMTNYYSIATGLYAESHGQVHNVMYDPPTGRKFWMASKEEDFDSMWWNGAEPIWITATRQNLTSYMYHWLGCEAVIRGLQPRYCRRHRGIPTISDLSEDITHTLHAFSTGQAHFSGIYVETPDHIGHHGGPDPDQNEALRDTLQAIDDQIARLLRELQLTKMTDNNGTLADFTNIMIVSDHGMAYKKHKINMTDVIEKSDLVDHSDIDEYLVTDWECSVVQIWPTPGKEDAFYDVLSGIGPHLHVYTKETMPERFHFTRHIRIPPLTLMADVGWVIKYKKPGYHWSRSRDPSGGSHGYDPVSEQMRAIFVAVGPYFKQNYIQRGLENVNLYQVMCHILGIEAEPHNGTWSIVADMLRTTPGGNTDDKKLTKNTKPGTYNETNINKEKDFVKKHIILVVALAALSVMILGAGVFFVMTMYQKRKGLKYSVIALNSSSFDADEEDYEDDEF